MSYFVFVDNSNVWIEGKVASAVAKGFALNTYDAHQKGIEDSSWRIDYGKLLSVVTRVCFQKHNPMNYARRIRIQAT